MSFFNYIFYRIAQKSFKRDGTSADSAVMLVSLLQTILLEFIIQPIFMYFLNKDELALHAKPLAWLAGAIFIILIILNYRKYAGKYEDYQTFWKNENPKKRFIMEYLLYYAL